MANEDHQDSGWGEKRGARVKERERQHHHQYEEDEVFRHATKENSEEGRLQSGARLSSDDND